MIPLAGTNFFRMCPFDEGHTGKGTLPAATLEAGVSQLRLGWGRSKNFLGLPFLSHSDDTSIAYRVFKTRKNQFLGSNHGFLHEVFNLCCKYDLINVWHGNIGFKSRSMMFLKKTVQAFNFKKKLKVRQGSYVVLLMCTSKIHFPRRNRLI